MPKPATDASEVALRAELARVEAMLARWHAGEPVPLADRKLLQKHGKIPHDGDEGPIRNQVAMAEYLSRRFNRAVGKMMLTHWLHGRRLPDGAPNMPPPNANGAWQSPDAVVAWFERWVVRSGASEDDLASASRDPKKAREQYEADIKKMERDKMRRAEDANYILVAKSLEYCRTANTIAAGLVTSAIESRIPAAIMDLPELVALDEAARGRIQAGMRATCERINGELQGEIAEKLKR